MKLVITEKPSAAQSVAKVIGAKKRCEGYLEGGIYITYCGYTEYFYVSSESFTWF